MPRCAETGSEEEKSHTERALPSWTDFPTGWHPGHFSATPTSARMKMKPKAGQAGKGCFTQHERPQSVPWREADFTGGRRLNRKLNFRKKNPMKPLKNEDGRMSQCQLFGEKAQHYHRTFDNKINEICFTCEKIGLLFSVHSLNEMLLFN